VANGKVAGVTLGENGELALYFKGPEINLEEISFYLSTPEATAEVQAFSQIQKNGSVYFRGDAEFMESGGETFNSGWDLSWDNTNTGGDNFALQSTAGGSSRGSVSLSVNGTLLSQPDRFEADFNSVDLELPDASGEMDLSLEVTITPDTGPIEAAGEVRELSSLTEMDVLEMYLKIMSDPQLGMLLEQFE
jgi:hypothetical protein